MSLQLSLKAWATSTEEKTVVSPPQPVLDIEVKDHTAF